MPLLTAEGRSRRDAILALRGDHRAVAQALRFLLIGGSNTIATFLLFVALQQVLEARVAYTISYAAGLAYTTVMTPRFVFRSEARFFALARFVAWYLCMYVLGLLIVHVTRDEWHSAWITAACTFAATAPLTFFIGRRLFVPRRPAAGG